MLILLLFALLAAAFSASAGVIAWTNTSGGNWNSQLNWSPNQVPAPGDDAVITNNGTYTVALNVNASPTSLTLGGVSGTQSLVIASSTLSLGAASAIIGNGVLELSGGTLSGAGALNVSNVLNWTAGAMSGSGRTVIAPGATLNLANASTVYLNPRTLENAGSVFWTGTGDLAGDPQAVLTNCPGGVWEVRNDRTFTWIGGTYPRFDNAGTFRKGQSTGTTTFYNFYFFNHGLGAVEVQSGTMHFGSTFNQAGLASLTNGAVLRLAGGGTGSGTFDVATYGLMDWTANYSLNPGAQLDGDGLYKVSSSSTLTLTTNANVAVRNLDLAGTLGVEGTLTVSNVLNWTAGAMSGGGRTVIAPGATLNLTNTTAVSVSTRTLENAGTVLCTGTADLRGGPQTVLTNRAGGVWEVRNDRTFTWIGGTYPRFDNAGIFRKSQGTGTTTFSSSFPFTNYGTLSVWQGTLSFAGTLSLGDSGTVEFGLAGVNYPTDYGRVNYGQPLQLTGRLAVVFRGGFVPGPSQQYLVMAAPILGTFQSYTAPTIPPAIFLNPLYQPNAVQLVTADATPSLSKLVMDGQRRFTLEIHGIASQLYVVEASTNFVVWTPLATNTMPASTVWQFVDVDSVKFPYRFYRAWFLPQSATPGTPSLTITRSNNAVIVSWPLPADGWVLEHTNTLSLSAAPWPQIPPPYQTNGGTLQFTEPAPAGSKFYRLRDP